MRDCVKCDHVVSAVANCFEQTFEQHLIFVCKLSSGDIVTMLKEDSSDSIFSVINHQTATLMVLAPYILVSFPPPFLDHFYSNKLSLWCVLAGDAHIDIGYCKITACYI